ncbi:MAG: hypothetical protein MI685_08370 [Chlorobiales bacterium]|nr:hypothetical protein [Chlorobiales bacterium]
MFVFDYLNLFLMNEAGEEGGVSGDGGNQDQGDSQKSDDNDNHQDKSLMNKEAIMKKDGDTQETQEKSDKKADRPDYLHEKFWDKNEGKPRIEAMAKAYADLEKKLGGSKKAPNEYKIELSDEAKKMFNEDAVSDDPMLNWFKGFAKENNFSQEQFNSAIEGFSKAGFDFMNGENAPHEINAEEEIAKLGKNADAILRNQEQFLEQLYKQGHINDAQMNEIFILTETAEGINALQAIRSYYGEKQNIPLNLNSNSGVKSSDELQAMLNDPKYGTNAEYTAEVDAAYEKKYGSGNSGQSSAAPLY